MNNENKKDTNRTTRKNKVKTEIPDIIELTHYSGWEGFLEEGDEYFKYLVEHYDTMINEEKKTITHFTVREGMYGLDEYVNKIKETDLDDIENQIIPWIIKERESNNLFDKLNWKPFRDHDTFTTMFFGYKKMVKYKKYWFQFAIDWICGNNCKCGDNNTHPHFVVALYGWEDEAHTQLQPYNNFPIPVDNKMPEDYWFLES